jgi:hypothetical protein
MHVCPQKVGSMSGNTIYGVKATEMVPIKPMKDGGVNQSWGKQVVGAVNKRLNPTQHEIAEQRCLMYHFCLLNYPSLNLAKCSCCAISVLGSIS